MARSAEDTKHAGGGSSAWASVARWALACGASVAVAWLVLDLLRQCSPVAVVQAGGSEARAALKTLADALATLGRGAHLLELQRIIHQPGWTSPAEFAFVNAILDHLSVEVRTIERLQADLVEASRKVKKDHH